MKKLIQLHLPYDLWETMARVVVTLNYSSRTAFIIEAIREKINRDAHIVSV